MANKAIVNAKTLYFEYTPLHLAVLGNGGQEIKPRSSNAYSDEYKATIKILLDGRAKIDGRSFQGSTALHKACEKGDSNVVKLLLDKGADHGLVDFEGKQPLHITAERCHAALVECLLARGVDHEARDHAADMPLYYAAKLEDFSVAQLLLEKIANVLAKDKQGQTP